MKYCFSTFIACLRVKFILIVLPILFSINKIKSQATEIILPIGHPDVINSIAISPDNNFIITGSEDELIKLWDVHTGLEIKTFRGHTDDIMEVNFSNNGKWILSASEDKTIKIWDVISGKEIKTIQAGDRVLSANFSIDDKLVIGGISDNTIGIWELKSGNLIQKLKGHNDKVTSISVDPYGKYIASGSNDKQVILWDLQKKIKIKTFKGHESTVNAVCFSPDGKNILSGGGEYNKGGYNIKLWSIKNGKNIKTFKGHNESVNDVIFSPTDPNRFISVSWNSINIWNTKNSKPIQTINQEKVGLQSIAFTSDGIFFLTSSVNTPENTGFGGSVKLWNSENNQLIRTFTGHSSAFKTIDISPNKKQIIAGQYKKIKIWNLETLHEIKTIKVPEGSIESTKFSPDGKYVAIAVWASIIIYETTNWTRIKEFQGKDFINWADFTPDSKHITGAFLNNKMIQWNIMTGAKTMEFDKHEYAVMKFNFSKDGNYLLSGSEDKTIKLWNAKTGESLLTFKGHKGKVADVTFSPDLKYVLSGSWDNSVKLWDLKSGKEIRSFNGHSDCVLSVAFSSNGKYILSGARDRTLKMWDVSTGNLIQSFENHKGWVRSLKFINNDKQAISSGSSDGTIKIWDLEKRKPLLNFILVDSEDWMIVGNNNFYTCSKGAVNKLGFKTGMKTYPFEQFDLKLNRPDLILNQISQTNNEIVKSYYKAYKKRLSKLNFTEDMLSEKFHIPELEILNKKEIPLYSKIQEIELQIKSWDTETSLDRINIWVNDVPIYGIKGKSLREKNIKEINFGTQEPPLKVKLSEGLNKIQVSVHNQNGIESIKKTVYTSLKKSDKKPNLYIVAIGVSEYLDKSYNLKYAVKDAKDVINLFKSKSENYSKVNILSLLNDNVNKENISSTKIELMKSEIEDEVLIFIAGHGLLDKNLDYYFATPNTDFQNPSKKGIPFELIENLMDNIPARKKLILIDACHSGELDKDGFIAIQNESKEIASNIVFRGFKKANNSSSIGLQHSFELMKSLFTDLRRGTGAIIISSASGVEFAYESDQWKNGVFTYALLNGLNTGEADSNKDGQILISELRKYVSENVVQLTNGIQHPTIRKEILNNDFKIW